MRFIPHIFAALILASCANRTIAPVLQLTDHAGAVTQVFVATHRVEEPAGMFTSERSEALNFMELQVSIPPGRRTGSIANGHANTDPNRHFAITGRSDIATANGFTAAIRSQLQQQPADSREVVIYTHGYNNSFADGVFRMAQMNHDFEVPGIGVHYSWPSAVNPFGYVHDRDAVLAARDGLETLLYQVRAAGTDEILLVGHSMGTLLIMETLRQIELTTPGWSEQNLSGVVLISPDISVDLFRNQADRIAALPQPFAIFVSQRDRALQLSARLTGQRERLGAIADATPVADYPVTVLDVSAFADGPIGHFTVGTSASLISILNQGALVDQAFQSDRSARTGLVPGTVIRVQNATQLILSPGLLLQN